MHIMSDQITQRFMGEYSEDEAEKQNREVAEEAENSEVEECILRLREQILTMMADYFSQHSESLTLKEYKKYQFTTLKEIKKFINYLMETGMKSTKTT